MDIMPVFKDLSSRFSYQIPLDGTVYTLSFFYNTREDYWYLSIGDADENIKLAGIKLVPNYLLLQQYRAYSEVPQGDFILIDINNNLATSDPDFDNFGVRYFLVYLTEEEALSYGI